MTPETSACFPLFGRLDPLSVQTLTAAARVVTLPAGTAAFQDGAACTHYVLVMEGSVRVQKVSESGREIVLYRVEAGQSCVLTTNCLLARTDYTAEGIAETPVKAMLVPATTFRHLLNQSEAFRDFVFSAYAIRIAELLLLIEEVAFGRMDMRLAAWLCQHGQADGQIHATHQDLATELGTAREVISRQLKDFERRGWVVLHRGRVEIRDSAGLSSLRASV